MAKPASGTTLDTGNALYTSLLAVWALLEGSTTSSADSKGSNTLTLSSSGLWSTNGGGENIIHLTSAIVTPLDLASDITLSASSSWSIAFRAKEATNGTAGMILGDQSGSNNFFWFKSNSTFTYRNGSASDLDFVGSAGDTTTTANWVLTYTHTGGGVGDVKCYRNGSQVGTTQSSKVGSLVIKALGNGYSSNTFSLIGDIEYVYIWDGRALSSGDVSTINSSPYGFFSAAGSAVITEQNLPANHNGNITVHLVGTGTSWTSSTTWTPSGVAGWSVFSKTQVDGTHYTVVLTPPGAATPPTGNTGTLTLTEGVTGSTTPTTVIGTPSFTLSVTSGATNGTQAETLTGTNTIWSSETASGLFTLSGGTGASISNPPTVSTNTSATNTITKGSADATLTVTDTSTGATATFTVAAAYTTLDLTGTTIAGVYVQVEGGATLGSFGGGTAWGQPSANWTDGAIHVKGRFTALKLKAYNNGAIVRLAVDGVDTASITLASGSSGYVVSSAFTGLDGSVEHDYILSWGSTMFVQELQYLGTGPTTTFLPARKVLAGYGDSITQGQSWGTVDSTQSWLHLAGLTLGYQVLNRGIGSTKVSSGTNNGEGRTADVTGATALPNPDVVVVLYGTVDAGASADLTVFGAAYLHMLQQIQVGLPNATIVNERLLKTGVGDTTRDTYSTKISDQVTTLGNSRVTYKTGMYGAYAGGDGIHPLPGANMTALAAAVVADIQASLPAGGGGGSILGGGIIR